MPILDGSNLKDLPRCTPENSDAETVGKGVTKLFTFASWEDEQIECANVVREHLIAAYLSILSHVPSSPARTRALNLLTDCRMLVNQAITFKGEV